jgi:hypothetical protein
MGRKLHALFSGLFILFLIIQLSAQSQQRRFIWASSASVPGAGTNLCNGMKTDIYENHYTVGRHYQFSPDSTVYSAIKYNPSGQKVWTQKFKAGNVTLPVQGEPKSIVHTYPDSSTVYLLCIGETIRFDTIWSALPLGKDMVAFRLDKDGKLMWWCQFGAGNDEDLIESFENSDSDIVIHGLTKFSSNKFYFQRPVDGVLVKDSTVYSSASQFDYYFTLKKDGTAGSIARVLNSNIEFSTLLGSFALPGNKIELIGRTFADNFLNARIKRWTMNGDGTGLTAAPESFVITYPNTSGRLDFGNMHKTSSGNYVANVYSNSGHTFYGADTFLFNQNYLISLSNDLSSVTKKKISAAGSPIDTAKNSVLWLSTSLTRLVLGTDTMKNKNNQFAQHFIITDETLGLMDTFQIINQNNVAKVKNAWLNDSLEVTCAYTQQYNTTLDTIQINAANKSWYHYGILAKRARKTSPNINTGIWEPVNIVREMIAYPNPIRCGEPLYLKVPPHSVRQIRLMTIDGKHIDINSTGSNILSTPQLKEGLYLLQIQQTNGKMSIQKILVTP